MDQTAIAGKYSYQGIPDPTISWQGATLARSLTIFTDVQKTPTNDRTQSEGNDGEVISFRRRNKRITIRFSAKPVGTAATDALAIAADLPQPVSTCTVTCSGDSQIASPAATVGTSIVDEASARYTPDGDLVVDFTVTHWLGKVFGTFS